MSSMADYKSQAGYVSGTLIALIIVSTLLAGSLAFGVWAFMSRQDYKNNSDKKAAVAADERQAEVEAVMTAKFIEEEKKPYTSHKAPDQYGSIEVQYPKTWSAYVEESASGNRPIDDYFHPRAVPDVSKPENAFALRIQVVDEAYDKVVKSRESDVRAGRLSASPYTLPKVPDVVGTRFDGQVERNKQGSLVILPLRNLTIKIWTESPNYLEDFNNIILPNLTFAP
jgi:hypothetical protein